MQSIHLSWDRMAGFREDEDEPSAYLEAVHFFTSCVTSFFKKYVHHG
jgi:hypothetical protein